MRTSPRRVLSLFALSVLARQPLVAQCFDRSILFHGAGASDWVWCGKTLDFGNGPALYVGGQFATIGHAVAARIAKWDGAQWSPLGDGIPGIGPSGPNAYSVRAIARFDDGSGPALYAGGHFPVAGSVSANNIAQWNGTSWSSLGSGVASGFVHALAEFDGGSGSELYVAGFFTGPGGLVGGNLARWNGTSWSGVGPGSPNDVVFDLVVHDDGSGPALYAAGTFSQIGGILANGVARWNGIQWQALPGLPSYPTNLAVGDDGSGPMLYASLPVPDIVARWNGSTWISLGQPHTTIGNVEMFNDGGAGNHLYAVCYAPNHVRRWSSGTWTPVVQNFEFYGQANTLFVDKSASLERLFVGGDITAALNQRADNIVVYNNNAWDAIELANSVNGKVTALDTYDSGGGTEMTIGGYFQYSGSVPSPDVGRWDGTTWQDMDGPIGLWGAPYDFLAWNDGSGEALFAGGYFNLVAFANFAGMARWDGVNWSPVGNGIVPTPNIAIVRALELFDDGSGTAMYAAGAFETGAGAASDNVVRWNGTTWSAVGLGVGDEARALAVYDGGSGPRLIVGGKFGSAGGASAKHIAAWNGTTWTTLGPGIPGGTSHVNALVVFDDGSGSKLYAGGSFTTAGTTGASNIARWDGTTWSALGGGCNGEVFALHVFDDGNGPALFAGGEFTSAGGVAAAHVARWNGSSWSAVGGGTNGPVNTFTVYDDGSGSALFLGGDFTVADGRVSNYIAKVQRACDCAQVAYCTAGTTTHGCAANIAATGGASASSSSGFDITVSNVEGQRSGLIFYGASGPVGVQWGPSSSYLCVKSPTQRTNVQSSGGMLNACDGSFALDFNAWLSANPNALGQPFVQATSLWAQAWFRDPASAKTTALSNALEFQVCP